MAKSSIKKITPLPWIIGDARSSVRHPVGGLLPFRIYSKDNVIGYIYESENAEFIVRACNAHDDLVAALSTALGDLRQYAGVEAGKEPAWFTTLYAGHYDALAKARGEA